MNSGIILTINLKGILGKKESNASGKQMQRKIMSSPFEYSIRGQKGTVNYITPVGHFLAQNDFKQSEDQKCVRKMNISEEVINEWTGSRAPFFVKEFIWKKMSKTQRLRAWIERFDEGFGVTYQEI